MAEKKINQVNCEPEELAGLLHSRTLAGSGLLSRVHIRK